MNIIEAVKSGKAFKRSGEKEWNKPICPMVIYSKLDILADDWEIEEQAVAITRSQLSAAWIRAHNLGMDCDKFWAFAKELGFK